MYNPGLFRNVFVNFAQAAPESLPSLPPVFDRNDDNCLILTLKELQAAQVRIRQADAIFATSEAIMRDVGAIEASLGNNELERRTMQFFRFVLGQVPLSLAMSLGLKGKAFDWLHMCVSRDHDPSRQYNVGYAFLPLRQEGDSAIAVEALRWTPDWISSLYLLARTTSGMNTMPKEFYETCWQVCWDLAQLAPQEDKIIGALSAMACWAVINQHPATEASTRALRKLWDRPEVTPWGKTLLGQVFCTDADQYTEHTADVWAEILLRDHGDALEEHQRLQFLSVAIRTLEDWEARKAELLSEVRKLSDLTKRESARVGVPWTTTLEDRVEVINPIMHTLMKHQHLEGVLDLLATWYGQAQAARCDGDVLFVCPTFESGTAYLWPGGGVFSPARDLPSLLNAIAKSFGTMRADGTIPTDWSEARSGLPVLTKGAALERAVRHHYQPEILDTAFASDKVIRAVVAYPSLYDAAPAIVSRSIGKVLPVETSFAAPAAMRPLRRISVWPDHTIMTGFEVDCIKAAGGKAGFTVDVFERPDTPTASDFQSFYEDPDADILWVIGHGKFEVHEPGQTGIQFGYDDVLPAATIAGFKVPAHGRRLLVLNVCSGAEAQITGGLARIGIAQALVGPHQAVVAHRWAIEGRTALAFGALLAEALTRHAPLDAVAEAIDALAEPASVPEKIVSTLGQQATADRLDPGDMEGVLHWGCPVLLV